MSMGVIFEGEMNGRGGINSTVGEGRD